MQCPTCNGPTRVVETRSAEGGGAIRRRRTCTACRRRFTTFERVDLRLYVRKRNGERQPFDRRKLAAALYGAAHKRAVSADQVEGIVDEAAAELERAGGELPAARIGELCLERLRELDWGAYLQFAGTLPEMSPDFAVAGAGGSVRPEGEDPQLPPDAA